MADGHATATFGWVSYDGYRYEITQCDDGVFEVAYHEDGYDEARATLTFNNNDADALIAVMQRMVDFYRETSEKRDT